MLRMSVTAQSPQQVVLALYGKIAGADVRLLRQEGERHLEQDARVTLELDGVQFIDDAGLALLRQWVDREVVLRGGSVFLRALLAAEGLEPG
jgi:ABC-type transporter Mla MlaB component